MNERQRREINCCLETFESRIRGLEFTPEEASGILGRMRQSAGYVLTYMILGAPVVVYAPDELKPVEPQQLEGTTEDGNG